jgi:RNA recognition motif-containing protein
LEVRIVTYKNGKSKGLAYVDFEDEKSASKAIVQTDNMLIGDKQIAVSISNPPKRSIVPPNDQQPTSKSEKQIKIQQSSLGGGTMTNRTAATSNDDKPKQTISSFMPRAQMLNNARKMKLNLK